MKVKIKKSLLKERVRQRLNEGFVQDLKKKFRGNIQGLRTWVKSNWSKLEPEYKQALHTYMGIRQVSKGRLNEAGNYKTYRAWKRAVKKKDPQAKFTGDKDIDSSYKKGHYDAEWDGDSGQIR